MDCKIIDIPKVPDPRGNLSFIQNGGSLPFEIARCYWIYDVPGGEIRHGHAFRRNSELIVALSGSFDVVVTDRAGGEQRYHLCRSYYGLYIPAGMWRHIDNFSTNSVAMVLASTTYNVDDYVRDFEEYKSFADDTE